MSEVVREIPSAGISRSVGMDSAISAERTPRSEGRTNPMRAVRVSTTIGLGVPAKAMLINVVDKDRVDYAHAAEQVAVADAITRHAKGGRNQRAGELQCPEQGEQEHSSPSTTSTYQPRINVSISKAHEVKRSAGHCRR